MCNRLLSQVYLAEPTADFAKLLQEGDLRNSLAELGVVFDEVFDTRDLVALREALKSEYTRLFLGPGHVPAYESVFTDQNAYAGGYGRMYGPAAQDVENIYLEHGFTADDEFANMPDQLGVELSFMGLLCLRTGRAGAESDADEVAGIMADEIKFVANHLLNWLPRFCDRAADFAELRFYKTIIALTTEFVLSDRQFLKSIQTEAADRPTPAGVLDT